MRMTASLCGTLWTDLLKVCVCVCVFVRVCDYRSGGPQGGSTVQAL